MPRRPQAPLGRVPAQASRPEAFAIRTLIDAYRDGGDPGARLPLLSTYLGHVDPGKTYWYLSAAPELLALAGDRLERYLGGDS